TTQSSTLSLHDALPISRQLLAVRPRQRRGARGRTARPGGRAASGGAGMSELFDAALRYLPRTVPLIPGSKRPAIEGWPDWPTTRSEEHTSELQSLAYLV